MSLLRKVQALFHDDWCSACTSAMTLTKKQLYALPTMMVGHYQSIEDPNYYVQHLIRVDKKSDIPTGCYACGAYLYHCPHCNKDVAKLTIFLPVRDQEQIEESHLMENPELLAFLRQN